MWGQRSSTAYAWPSLQEDAERLGHRLFRSGIPSPLQLVDGADSDTVLAVHGDSSGSAMSTKATTGRLTWWPQQRPGRVRGRGSCLNPRHVTVGRSSSWARSLTRGRGRWTSFARMARMPRLIGLDHLVRNVSDVERSLAHYTGAPARPRGRTGRGVAPGGCAVSVRAHRRRHHYRPVSGRARRREPQPSLPRPPPGRLGGGGRAGRRRGDPRDRHSYSEPAVSAWPSTPGIPTATPSSCATTATERRARAPARLTRNPRDQVLGTASTRSVPPGPNFGPADAGVSAARADPGVASPAPPGPTFGPTPVSRAGRVGRTRVGKLSVDGSQIAASDPAVIADELREASNRSC